MATTFPCEARDISVARRRHLSRRATASATRPKGRHRKTLSILLARSDPASESLPRFRALGVREPGGWHRAVLLGAARHAPAL